MNEYLKSGRFVDSAHPGVVAFTEENASGRTDRDRAVSLYYAIRDGIRYNPFENFMLDDAYRGSTCLQRGEGWCVPKAARLAACARAAGIPARGGYADVKNHPTTPALTEKMGTDLFVLHGYAEPLPDGTQDSIFHPLDEDNRRHMEYVRERGSYADVPADEIKRVFQATYPKYYNLGPDAHKESFAPA